jgi:hypothetical protein
VIHLDWDNPIHWNGVRRKPCTHCERHSCSTPLGGQPTRSAPRWPSLP